MKAISKSVGVWECAALLYLLAPVVVFFLTFSRWEIALVATPLLALVLTNLIRRTTFELPKEQIKNLLWFALLSVAAVVIGGAGGLTYVGGDWGKHYAILNYLLKNDWPPTSISPNGEVEVLRYALGWYLVPALLAKWVGASDVDLFSAGWSVIGLTIFFSMVSVYWPGWKGKVLGPVIFLLFSGMDYVGTQITGYLVMKTHWEWWAGWMQYTANITSLFWVPQHVIPAWLAIALLMKQWESPTLLDHLTGLLVAVMLWSPFIAVGLLPFYAVLLGRHGVRPMIFHWRPIATGAVVGLPLAIYLTSFTKGLTQGFIWTLSCVPLPYSPPCFSLQSYALVLLLEVAPFVVLVLLAQRANLRPFVWASVVALAILPFYRIGLYNDLTMRGSAPALAVLAILCVRTIFTAQLKLVLPLLVVLIIGLVTPFGELERSFTMDLKIRPTAEFGPTLLNTFRQQYFAPHRTGVLRVSGH